MLLLLPPVGLDRRCWDWLDLPGVEVARYEPPGIGERAGEQPLSSMDGLADEIAARHPGRSHVVGVSFGGMIAQHLALRHPEQVDSLFLAATTAEVDSALVERRAAKTEQVGMSGVLEETLQRWFTEGALAAGPRGIAIAYAQRALLACDPAVFAASWRAMGGHHVLADLPAIGAPTTCVAGLRDASTPRESLEAVASAVAGARIVTIDGPHMVHLENPLAFSRALADHLAWAGGAG